jgi:hypothetical protein
LQLEFGGRKELVCAQYVGTGEMSLRVHCSRQFAAAI